MSSYRVRGVLFDLDGVLIDSSRAWFATIVAVRSKLGLPAIVFDDFFPTFGQGVEADRDAYFAGQTVEQVVALYDELFVDHLDEVRLMRGALDVLEHLRDDRLKLAVVTNTPRVLAERVIRDKQLWPLIDALAAAGEAADKPAPDLIELALERVDLAASEVVYVGDSPTDQRATAAAGVEIVGIGKLKVSQHIDELSELLPLIAA
ncbi:MAG: HAD family hydrolase [Deltaproteobacteria bacterium]|nr:HAD family hydrolase [Deltaproteobacteria bacterium]